jgi:O-antigen/teichoic acid export membrane protein
LLPRLFLLNAGKSSQELRRVFLRSTLYTSGLAGSLYLGVFLLAEPFFRLWLGPDFAESAHLARMLVVPLLLYQVATPSAAMLLSLGKQRHLGGLAGLEIAVLLGILLWWPGPADAAKAAAALAVALVCLRPVWLPWFTCRQVGLSLGRYWLAAAGRGLAPVLAMALPLAWLASMWEVDSWGELALAAGAIAAAALGAFLVGGLDSGERAYWRRLLARPRTPGGGEEAP